MKASLDDYLKRGGTKLAIANAWGKSRQTFNDYMNKRPKSEGYRFTVWFNPVSPSHVWKFAINRRSVPERVEFDLLDDQA